MTNDHFHCGVRKTPTSNRAGAALCLAALAAVLGGCASQEISPTAMGMHASVRQELAASDLDLPGAEVRPRAMFSVATLGAGDALGTMIVLNDMVLAAAQRLNDQEGDTALADVPTP